MQRDLDSFFFRFRQFLRRAGFALSLATAILIVAAPSLSACSSGGDGCDDSKCAKGNKCVNDGSVTACRLLCPSQTACPANFHCASTPDGKETYCKADKTKYGPSKGQWGVSCNPAGGLDNNPDCDNAQNFWCYGQLPTDGAAYCTQYQCTDDNDCAGGFWCAHINNQPSVQSVKRSFGADQTTTACLKREYCAECKWNVDCPPVGGVNAYCVAGSDGAKFCTTECVNDGNCNPDSDCKDTPSAGGPVCIPRAGTCKGDGTFCSPCFSDAECKDGFCLYDVYTHEHYCSQKSNTPCGVLNGKLQADCPKTTAAGGKVSCATTTQNPAIPKDQCYGIVEFGTDPSDGSINYLDGCWTRPKK